MKPFPFDERAVPAAVRLIARAKDPKAAALAVLALGARLALTEVQDELHGGDTGAVEDAMEAEAIRSRRPPGSEAERDQAAAAWTAIGRAEGHAAALTVIGEALDTLPPLPPT